MKSPILGLALSTVAFGASTVYFALQLSAVQKQAEAMDKANAALTSRVAELQKRREEFAEQRMAMMGATPPRELRAEFHGPPPGDGAPPPSDGKLAWTPGNREFRAPPPMPDAMMKMMRANMRAQNKLMYFDLQSKLGLTDDQTSKLLDLITDQRTAGFRGSRSQDPEQARQDWEADQTKRQAAITDLLGPDKAAAYEDYQKTMPARSELMMISQQLDGAETPLTDSQRTQMLDALVTERDRVPMPTWVEGTPSDQMAQQYADWQADYDKRVADAERSVLSADQMNTVTQYQQWQSELRQQFGGGPGGGGHMRGNVMFAPGPQGSVAFSTVTDSASSRPTEKPANSK